MVWYRSLLGFMACGALITNVVGCSSYTAPMAVGGASGAAVGAGTGALIGAAIANGDVAASALLGGAIGLPVGLAIGAIYHYNSEPSMSARMAETVEKNREEIFARQREIDTLREDLRNEAPRIELNDSNRKYDYNGPTFGNYYR